MPEDASPKRPPTPPPPRPTISRVQKSGFRVQSKARPFWVPGALPSLAATGGISPTRYIGEGGHASGATARQVPAKGFQTVPTRSNLHIPDAPAQNEATLLRVLLRALRDFAVSRPRNAKHGEMTKDNICHAHALR